MQLLVLDHHVYCDSCISHALEFNGYAIDTRVIGHVTVQNSKLHSILINAEVLTQ